MGLIIRQLMILAALVIAVGLPSVSIAGWSGPTTVVQLAWGSEATAVGLRIGDTLAYDRRPGIAAILNNYVVIEDGINSSRKVFDPAGTLISQLPYGGSSCLSVRGASNDRIWCIWFDSTQDAKHAALVHAANGQRIWTASESFSDSGRALDATSSHAWFFEKYLYDATGTLIRETTERPLELGRWKIKETGGVRTRHVESVRLEYPDVVFQLTAAQQGALKNPFQRLGDTIFEIVNQGQPGNEHVIAHEKTAELDPLPDGRRQVKLSPGARLDIPDSSYNCVELPPPHPTGSRCEVIEEYSQWTLGPDGSAYTTKRTPDHFQVLKRTWTP